MKKPVLQDLPKDAARMALEVERFITREIKFDPSGKELVLAYSGGADSKALFHILLVLAPRLNFSLALAHLDHALRETSAAEAEAAEELARVYGLPCHTSRVDVAALSQKLKLGKEEAGRAARLEFMTRLQHTGLKEGVERWAVFAHQLNDLAEDMIMRLLRGAGWPALGGMRAVDAARRLLRPLLLTGRSEIEGFLASLKEDWVKDTLNEDQSYLRNRVRARVMPFLLEENPSFLDAAADLWRLSGWDGELYSNLLGKVSAKAEDGCLTLDHAALGLLPKALRLRAYKKTLETVPGPGQPLLTGLLALDRAWSEKKSGAELQFPGNKKARVIRGTIKFSRG